MMNLSTRARVATSEFRDSDGQTVWSVETSQAQGRHDTRRDGDGLGVSDVLLHLRKCSSMNIDEGHPGPNMKYVPNATRQVRDNRSS